MPARVPAETQTALLRAIDHAIEYTRAARVCVATVDVVSRKWIDHLLTAEQDPMIVRVAFDNVLEAEGLWERIEARAD